MTNMLIQHLDDHLICNHVVVDAFRPDSMIDVFLSDEVRLERDEERRPSPRLSLKFPEEITAHLTLSTSSNLHLLNISS